MSIQVLFRRNQHASLEKIFLALCTADLKNCALVCRLWHDYLGHNGPFAASSRVSAVLCLKRMTESIDRDADFYRALFLQSLRWERHLLETLDPRDGRVAIKLEGFWHAQGVDGIVTGHWAHFLQELNADIAAIPRSGFDEEEGDWRVRIDRGRDLARDILMRYHQLKETVRYELDMAMWHKNDCVICYDLCKFFDRPGKASNSLFI